MLPLGEAVPQQKFVLKMHFVHPQRIITRLGPSIHHTTNIKKKKKKLVLSSVVESPNIKLSNMTQIAI